MSNTKISQLPNYTGSTDNVYVVMDNADLSGTYRVKRENLINISGTTNNIPYYNANNTLTSVWYMHNINNGYGTLGLGTEGYTVGQPERLVVDAGSSYNIATFQTSEPDSYGELNIKNFGGGANASTDLVIWNDATNENSLYVDLGINSSTYSGASVGYQSDGYLINAANDMYIGSTSTGTHGHVHIFGGNLWQSASISVYQDGTIGINTDKYDNSSTSIPTAGFVMEVSGSVKLNNSLSVVGNITGSILHATNNGNGTNFKVGDDAWIGDVNRANTLQIMGQEDVLQGYIKFGSGSSSPSFGYGGSNDHVDLSCALKLNQMATLPTATVGTLAVSGSHLYFHNGTGWNQIA